MATSTLQQFFAAGGTATGPGINFPGYGASRYYPPTLPGFTDTPGTMTASVIYATPFYCQQTFTFAGMSVQQTTNTPTGTIRLGVYNDSSGAPGTLNTDLGTASFIASTGIRTVSGSLALVANTWYWMAAIANAALAVNAFEATTTQQFQNIILAQRDHGLISTAVTGFGTSGYQGLAPVKASQAFGALPTPFPTVTGYDTNGPLIYMKT